MSDTANRNRLNALLERAVQRKIRMPSVTFLVTLMSRAQTALNMYPLLAYR